MIIVPPTTPLITSELHTSIDLITPPQIEPIDLDEFKKHLRFTPTREDTLIDLYIAMARMLFEEYTGRQLLDATWEYKLEAFPAAGTIYLPKPPLLEVLSVTYADADGADQVLTVDTDYRVAAPVGPYCKPGSVRFASSGAWPTVTPDLDTVRIRYRAGYGTQPGDVPELIRGALGFLAAHFFENRVEVVDQAKGSFASLTSVPLGADYIMRAFKVLPSTPYPRRVV